jgi:integrase/recombinase XerD
MATPPSAPASSLVDGVRPFRVPYLLLLADVPPALTWFANIDNPQTRRAYQNDVEDFMSFTGIIDPLAFREVARAHVLAWRRDLELRALGGSTIRRKLAALSSLFESMCEANAIQGNPVDGVKRPKN